MELNSTFALVDIQGPERHKLADALGIKGNQIKVPISLTGFLVCQSGGDDGTSIEFCMDVDSTEVKFMPATIVLEGSSDA